MMTKSPRTASLFWNKRCRASFQREVPFSRLAGSAEDIWLGSFAEAGVHCGEGDIDEEIGSAHENSVEEDDALEEEVIL